MRRIRSHILILLTIASSLTFAQSVSDSLSILSTVEQQNKFHTKFDKQLNTYYLTAGFRYGHNFGKSHISIFENFNSTFIKSGEKSIRDEQVFSILGAHDFNPSLSSGIYVNSVILSDNRRIEINQASASSVNIFTGYKPQEKIALTPFIGIANNRQIGQSDNGLIYGAEGLIDDLHVSDFSISSEIKFRNEDISPRKNTQRYLNFYLVNDFEGDVSNFVNIKYIQQRKDFYYEADSITSREFDVVNNIQSRIESSYMIQDRLYINRIFNLFTLDLTGKAIWRNIDRNTRYRTLQNISSSIFDTKINELRLEFESAAGYSGKIFNGSLRMLISERDEKHITKNFDGAPNIFFEERSRLESRKNNNSTRASVSLLGEFRLSGTDRLLISLFQNKLRYDTPSDDNFDDRDELLSIVRLRYSKKLNPFFEAFVSAEGTYNHIVYILAERSSNNNLNRILRLAAGGDYRGKNVSSLNSFEVSANYTVYDFEDLNPNFRSFSFRQFTAVDSSQIKLNNRFTLGFYGYIKLSEQGDLRWASFSTKPTRYLEELFGEPKIILNYDAVSLAMGVRYFSLKTFNYDKRRRVLFSRYRSLGPTTEVIIFSSQSLYFRIYGWYEFINLNFDTDAEQANVMMEVKWNF